MEILIERKYGTESTIGSLYIDGEFECFTLERPWLDNQRRLSCIPEATYGLELKQYGRWHERWKDKIWYKGMLILSGTEPRSEILIHVANYPKELLGCIAPGVATDGTNVWSSKKALMKIYPEIADAILSKEEVTIKLNEHNQEDQHRVVVQE